MFNFVYLKFKNDERKWDVKFKAIFPNLVNL